MANPLFQATSPVARKSNASMKPPPTGVRGPSSAKSPEKSRNWPGLPGKEGPDRSSGTPRVKQHTQSKGL